MTSQIDDDVIAVLCIIQKITRTRWKYSKLCGLYAIFPILDTKAKMRPLFHIFLKPIYQHFTQFQ